jgi:peroxin-12
MNGEGAGAPWEEEITGGDETAKKSSDDNEEKSSLKRGGKWESGKGRCPVTGRRVLGGTEGLRRVLI